MFPAEQPQASARQGATERFKERSAMEVAPKPANVPEGGSYGFLSASPLPDDPTPARCECCGQARPLTDMERSAFISADIARARKDEELFTMAWLDAHRPHGGMSLEIAHDCADWLKSQGRDRWVGTSCISEALERLECRGLVRIRRHSRMPSIGPLGLNAVLSIPRAQLYELYPELARPARSRGRR
jgi:hypothetical protein